MPIFLSAPPKPVASCPLKWFREMKTSASMIGASDLRFLHKLAALDRNPDLVLAGETVGDDT